MQRQQDKRAGIQQPLRRVLTIARVNSIRDFTERGGKKSSVVLNIKDT
jgi:hypothetical protein